MNMDSELCTSNRHSIGSDVMNVENIFTFINLKRISFSGTDTSVSMTALHVNVAHSL